jgi:hypothetical protein
MLCELKNPDFTKSYEERQKLKGKDFKFWWNIEHQYPYILPVEQQKRIWCNPFYLPNFLTFWIICIEKSGDEKVNV